MAFHVWEKHAATRICMKCGLEDHNRTIECPQRIVTEEEKSRIRSQDLDFSDGKWRRYRQFLPVKPRP